MGTLMVSVLASITVGTGVTISDGRVTCTTLHGSGANITGISSALQVIMHIWLTKTGGFGHLNSLKVTSLLFEV